MLYMLPKNCLLILFITTHANFALKFQISEADYCLAFLWWATVKQSVPCRFYMHWKLSINLYSVHYYATTLLLFIIGWFFLGGGEEAGGFSLLALLVLPPMNTTILWMSYSFNPQPVESPERVQCTQDHYWVSTMHHRGCTQTRKINPSWTLNSPSVPHSWWHQCIVCYQLVILVHCCLPKHCVIVSLFNKVAHIQWLAKSEWHHKTRVIIVHVCYPNTRPRHTVNRSHHQRKRESWSYTVQRESLSYTKGNFILYKGNLASNWQLNSNHIQTQKSLYKINVPQ